MRKPKTKKAATKANPADRATVEAKRAKTYSEMEPYVCNLSHAATLAMEVSDMPELFLFAVSQLDDMVQQFRANYYANEFLPE